MATRTVEVTFPADIKRATISHAVLWIPAHLIAIGPGPDPGESARSALARAERVLRASAEFVLENNRDAGARLADRLRGACWGADRATRRALGRARGGHAFRKSRCRHRG